MYWKFKISLNGIFCLAFLHFVLQKINCVSECQLNMQYNLDKRKEEKTYGKDSKQS